MISGVMPCAGWLSTGYPWQHAMKCWARVCDELVVVTHMAKDIGAMAAWGAAVEQMSAAEGRACRVLVRSVVEPSLSTFPGYGLYLLLGTFMATEPDWMLAVEADYLIAPEEALRLRWMLERSQADVVLARAVTLNYDCTRKVWSPDFKQWYPPFDGCSWDRPIGCRPKAGVFPTPYEGVDKSNLTVNCEGYIAMRPGKWGASFNSKFLGHNPHGLDLLVTNVEYEHPQFTRNAEVLVRKLGHDYFVKSGLGPRKVLEGDEPYARRYAELDRIRADYAEQADFLRKYLEDNKL